MKRRKLFRWGARLSVVAVVASLLLTSSAIDLWFVGVWNALWGGAQIVFELVVRAAAL